jgi:hypothetical protein
MMPSLSICRNSFFAAASFLLSRWRNLHDRGGPLVTMWCSTSPDGYHGRILELLTIGGKSASSFSKLSAEGAAGASAGAAAC